jgi:hypothetical protein
MGAGANFFTIAPIARASRSTTANASSRKVSRNCESCRKTREFKAIAHRNCLNIPIGMDWHLDCSNVGADFPSRGYARLLFPAKLLAVDDLRRRSGPGLSHHSLADRELVADDRSSGIDVNPSGSESAHFHLQFFSVRTCLLREIAYSGSRGESEVHLQ